MIGFSHKEDILSLKYFLNCIYVSSEGEGVHLGKPQIFVRFQGCSIGCVNCDSKETWAFVSKQDQSQSLDQVLTQIHELSTSGRRIPIKRVSITGGDPLHPSHHEPVLALVEALKAQGFYINIEASGTRVVPEIFDLVDFISFDYKTPSTGVKTPLRWVSHLVHHYPGKFQIKSVIASLDDFEYVRAAYEELMQMEEGTEPLSQEWEWCLTPAYHPDESWGSVQENFTQLLHLSENEGANFRVIGQQHKWVYGPDRKQV
jgi:7-carboxy-7-deazaguanine synthase